MKTTLGQSAREIIAGARIGHLAIIRGDGTPTIRPIGAFAGVGGDSPDLWFSTPRESEKFTALTAAPRVNFYFEDTTGGAANYKAVSLLGLAEAVTPGTPEFATAAAAIAARSPFFKQKLDAGDLAGTAIVRVRASEVRVSDYALARGIQKLVL
ncbi:MAG: pyridoxamine 5'-phosphate oxidase family protein [Puniceicoccales bacterium]|jgi:nitroimidazol reductase NimA-like FMN-containing flavoprotein (pyridoxamine 5'-phosphate oxidase superfamily)|nr:pyridoxamine 5'-phosphate oxidase family protein [Puniceicoccales bacterium]